MVIEGYAREAGVRNLDKQLSRIVRSSVVHLLGKTKEKIFIVRDHNKLNNLVKEIIKFYNFKKRFDIFLTGGNSIIKIYEKFKGEIRSSL